MTADDEPLTSKLAALGDGGIDDSELDERVAAFKDALCRLREDPVEAARIDALVLDAAPAGTITCLQHSASC